MNLNTYEEIYKIKEKENCDGWLETEGYVELKEWLKLLFDKTANKSGKLLEIGCGAGNLSIYLSELGFYITGIDISETAILWAKNRFNSLNLEAQFLVCYASNLSAFNSNSFDVSIDSLCLHCLVDEDRSKSLSEIYRVLKIDGEFLVITMCGNPKNSILKEHFNPENRYVEFDKVRQCYLGEPDDILNELQAVNFEIVYHIIIQGNEETGDQDMLLAIARKSKPKQKVGKAD